MELLEGHLGMRNWFKLKKFISKNKHPWGKTYPASVDWDETIPVKPLYSFLDDSVARFDENPCIDFLGKKYTYREIGDLVSRAAQGFQHLGVKKGTKVGLCLPNTPYFIICYFAILKAGGTVVNFNPLYVERELSYQIEDSETEIMVTLDLKQIYPKIATMLEETRLRCVVICQMSDILPAVKSLLFSVLRRSEIAEIPDDIQHVPFNKLIDNDGKFAPVEIDPHKDLALLQYTGGTTGTPKGAMLTHANLCANTTQVCRWFVGAKEGEEKIVGVLPFFHVFAMTLVMNMGIALGAELILLPRYELDALLQTINKNSPTILMGVPTIFTAINSSSKLDNYDLSSIQYCISGGAPLPLEVKNEFEQLTGCILVEGYGLSECSPVVTCNPLVETKKEGSIGLPMPGTLIEIRDPSDPKKKVPRGEKGEVCVRGPQVMIGYWKRPEETAKAINKGRFHTGDIGYMDEDGYTYLLDRIKDLILCGGYNVYPRMIEEAILLHPSVSEVTVIGVPDEYRGENPKAFVKLHDGEQLTAKELHDFLGDKLSRIEMPKEIEFRDNLPKTMIGKLSKKELVAEEKKMVSKV